MIVNLRNRVFMVTEVKPKKSIRKQVEERLAACKCLYHDENGQCEEPAETLGNCSKHYQRYYHQCKRLDAAPAEQAAYRDKLIYEGLIAESRQGQRVKEKNAFDISNYKS